MTNRAVRVARIGLMLALAGCGGGGKEPAPATSNVPAGNPAGGMRGMMAGGGGMRGGMMGNAPRDTAAAPTAQVATADAPGCPTTSQPLVDQGRTIFTGPGNCYACHGSDAKGTAAAPDLTDSSWLNIDGSYGAIAQLVRTGVAHPKQFSGVMPPKGGASLDSAQVCAVAAYVYSLAH